MADNNDDSFEVIPEDMVLPEVKMKSSMVDNIIAKG